ncbi:hypothetical protein TEA_015476 [Camellia sinensis var. sinensis]|uniref:Uncharacterized protein n=1 Tax=Camellia sinensis var. sinensis TaxID=542762 RepID=A0A4S4DML0_CAMSN|nr:hypothetical protein TEA_015476 [Camellia sinensis var. sinensis]
MVFVVKPASHSHMVACTLKKMRIEENGDGTSRDKSRMVDGETEDSCTKPEISSKKSGIDHCSNEESNPAKTDAMTAATDNQEIESPLSSLALGFPRLWFFRYRRLSLERIRRKSYMVESFLVLEPELRLARRFLCEDRVDRCVPGGGAECDPPEDRTAEIGQREDGEDAKIEAFGDGDEFEGDGEER